MRSMLRTTILAAVVTATAAAAESPAIAGFGTWKLNQEKSSFSPGPAPKDLVTTFEPAGAGIKWTSRRTGPDGKTIVSEFTAHYDGKDYPVAGSPTADAVALRRIDARTTERLNKKAGKVVSTERRVVAPDGKSYTTTVTGTTATGAAIDTRMVFDRQ